VPRLPKRAIRNEIRHPYIVQVAIVGDELNVQLGRRIMHSHKSQSIQPRYGRTITTSRAKLYRWCFCELLVARAFIDQFGGELYKHGINDSPNGGSRPTWRSCRNWRLAHFTYSMTVPSETVGAAAPILPAFLAIQSRAARVLSSVPALSTQTVTENPPSAVRASK
jgi:hypothetical protein